MTMTAGWPHASNTNSNTSDGIANRPAIVAIHRKITVACADIVAPVGLVEMEGIGAQMDGTREGMGLAMGLQVKI